MNSPTMRAVPLGGTAGLSGIRLLVLCLVSLCNASAEELELLVGQKISHSVGFYTEKGTQIATVPVGKHPHEMILSQDGRYLYVTDNGMLWMTDPGEGGNTISIIDVHQRQKIGAIDLGRFRRPHGMDLDPRSGQLVVTVENPDGLLLVDPAQRKVVRHFDVKGKAPHMVRLGPAAVWAYVSNTNSNTIAAIRLETGEVKLIPTGGRPQGGALSHDGKLLYVTNADGNSISIVDTAKNELISEFQTDKGPGRVALTPDRQQLVYNLQAGSALGLADIASRMQTTVIPLPGPPLSLSLSPDGKLAFTGVQSLDKICVVSVAERRIVRVIETPKGSGPDAVLAVRR